MITLKEKALYSGQNNLIIIIGQDTVYLTRYHIGQDTVYLTRYHIGQDTVYLTKYPIGQDTVWGAKFKKWFNN